MSQLILQDTDSELARLIQHGGGEEVLIVLDSKPVAKIVFLPERAERPKQGGFGSGKDDILYMADDFDAPLEDFGDYT